MLEQTSQIFFLFTGTVCHQYILLLRFFRISIKLRCLGTKPLCPISSNRYSFSSQELCCTFAVHLKTLNLILKRAHLSVRPLFESCILEMVFSAIDWNRTFLTLIVLVWGQHAPYSKSNPTRGPPLSPCKNPAYAPECSTSEFLLCKIFLRVFVCIVVHMYSVMQAQTGIQNTTYTCDLSRLINITSRTRTVQ